MRHRTVRLLASLSLGALLAACDTPLEPVPPAAVVETDPVAALGPGIHAILVAGAPSGGRAGVVLELRRNEVVASVASFQAELLYDAGRMKLVEAAFPEGILGAWFEVEPGRVRIAGARLEGMADGPVLSLAFETGAPIEEAAFGFAFEELRAAGDFADLRPTAVLPDRLPLLPAPSL